MKRDEELFIIAFEATLTFEALDSPQVLLFKSRLQVY